MPADPFTFEAATLPPLARAASAAARPFFSWILRAGECRRIYHEAQQTSLPSFEAGVLEALDIDVTCDPGDLARIPRVGPVIVAANHPHGALDGLAMAVLLGRARPDVRLLANRLLERIPELAASCFFVDPFDSPGAESRSRAGLRAAHLWLRRGGLLIVFPSGEVSPRVREGLPVDSPWKTTVGALAAHTRAQIVPAFIAGSNRRAFYAAGRLHAALRTALLARELLAQRGRSIAVRLGEPLAPQALGDAATPDAITAAARCGSDRLSRTPAPLDEVDRIAAEIDALPAAARLVNGTFRVYGADASAIPATLQEIGRLRAVAYGAAGEGTGRAIDIDRFDEHYLHLFAWDAGARRIVGAYRLGRTDRLVGRHGVAGLYTRTLFRYGPEFVERLSPALELGRSFVSPEYQKHPSALLALWKGIGTYVARHPQYRVLLGPVSISTRYSDASHALLAAFLEQNYLDSTLASLVESIHGAPARSRRAATGPAPVSVEEADRLVATLEADGKGMPVLLRHYLRLNARLIGFNVDPDFGDVLDALMMVDLADVDRAILVRYLGRAGAEAVLARRGSRPAVSAAA